MRIVTPNGLGHLLEGRVLPSRPSSVTGDAAVALARHRDGERDQLLDLAGSAPSLMTALRMSAAWPFSFVAEASLPTGP